MEVEVIEKEKDVNIIVKANYLIEARYRLPVNEQRLLLMMISRISPKDEDFKTYKITVSEFAELLEIKKGGDVYNRVKETAKTLGTRRLDIYREETKSWLNTGWLSSSEYFDGDGYVELCFDPKLKPYLLELKTGYTKYLLDSVCSFKNEYSIRIYEHLRQYRKIGERTFTIKELREVLEIHENAYTRYHNFKVKVLDVVQREIQQKTEIKFEIHEKRLSRIVTHLTFVMSTNTENSHLIIKGKKKLKPKEPNIFKDTLVCNEKCFKIDK